MTRRPATHALTLIAALVVPFALTCPAAAGQEGDPHSLGENQFGVSSNLFTVLAAINAAGYDTGIDSALNDKYKLRTQIREELAKRQIPSLPELKALYKDHKKPTGAADLGQYISFSLLAGDSPKFELPSGDLPPDVEPLRPLSALLERFYKEADIEDLWKRSQQAYQGALREYQDPIINTLFEANGYLRNPSGNAAQRFQIFIDLLGEPNQAQVRSYKNDYYVVITPTAEPVLDEIRDAYLAYLIDPLSFKYASAIKDKQALQKFADDAPALDLAYKDDFKLLVTKCLIKAINSRLMHGGAEKREAYVNDAMRQGFILTAAFADLLPRYEARPDAFRLYYPDLIAAVDVKKEQKRLREVQFVQSVAPRIVAPPTRMALDPAEESLQTAEGLYEQRDLSNAEKTFKKVFEQTADKSMHGRAYYGLARIAAREQRLGEARELFQRTADSNPNPTITAWAHVYLGRLALAGRDPEKANEQFKTALAINGISAMARDAAEKGLESSSTTGDKQQ